MLKYISKYTWRIVWNLFRFRIHQLVFDQIKAEQRGNRTFKIFADFRWDGTGYALIFFISLEKHLEEFLVANWSQTELGKSYDIYEENGLKIGQQYQSDSGPMDILAISKDRKTLLVVELKRGKASDVVVGQILRYMGYVQDELLEPNQCVKGVIIAQEDDQRLRRALKMTPMIEFYRYQVSFRLVGGWLQVNTHLSTSIITSNHFFAIIIRP